MPRLGATSLCTALGLALAALRLAAPAPLEWLELKAGDLRHTLRGAAPTSGRVVIVGIDEASLDAVGRWPWPRSRLADLVARIDAAGPAAIGLDAVFDKPDPAVDLERLRAAAAAGPDALAAALREQSDNDAALAAALRASGRVVLGEFFDFGGAPQEKVPGFPEVSVRQRGGATLDAVPAAPRVVVDVPPLAKAAWSVGHLNFLPDADGGFRRVPLVLRVRDRVAPSLDVELLRRLLGAPPALLTVGPGDALALTLGDRPLPVDRDGTLRLDFRGPPGTFPHVSAADVLAGTAPAAALAGKVVLVAPTAVGFDSRPTPFSGSAPGVEIHATVVDDLLRGRGLVRPAWFVPLEALAVLLLGIAVGVAIRWRGVLGPVVALGLGVGWLAATQWAFVAHGVLLGAVYPTAVVVAGTLGGTWLQYRREAEERARVRRAFRHYVDPEVAELIAREPERLKLGGERREVTVLFSDLRGFSGIAESMAPEDLAHLLNEHLGAMTDVLFEHRGLLDKYIGDAVMALWGAPLDLPEHAAHASRAALAMTATLARLQRGWTARGWPTVRMGVGLDTGDVVVGNFGSPVRFSYTAMGDHVNQASRLEGLNKSYGTEILATEATRRAAGDAFVWREIDRVRVVGKRVPATLFELLGTVADDRDGALARRAAAFAPVLAAYRARRWDEAMAAAEALLAVWPDDAVAARFVARCRAFAAAPPAPDWDAVHEPGTK